VADLVKLVSYAVDMYS